MLRLAGWRKCSIDQRDFLHRSVSVGNFSSLPMLRLTTRGVYSGHCCCDAKPSDPERDMRTSSSVPDKFRLLNQARRYPGRSGSTEGGYVTPCGGVNTLPSQSSVGGAGRMTPAG